jgi:LuxR family maltose regulon positive regulatory protein
MVTQHDNSAIAGAAASVLESTAAEILADFEPRESKLRPPLPSGSVARTSLLETLTGARSRRLILVTAPAGYGKTTLLAQWAGRARRPFGWVSLDGHDNDPAALMAHVATVVDRVAPLERDVFRALAEPGASIEARVIRRFGSAMAAIDRSFVLVLDDVHTIYDPRCVDAIDSLIEHVPGGSQLVLAGRSQPSQRVASMRAAGFTLELGPEKLRMDEAEAGELISAAELELPAAEVSRLVERTEGWPAGLYLGALSISAGGIAAQDEDTLRGDDRFVADYLRVEVLSELPSDDRLFMVRSSILERLSGPLCDAVLDSQGSGETLERMRRSNLFVMPLDRHAQWYRYHDLLREMLRAELEHVEPDLAPELLTRASEWFDDRGMRGEAVAYAQAADDVERVWRLVAAGAQAEYQRGRATTVERWFERLHSRDAPERDPMIAALGAWFSALQGQPDRAERWADIAVRAARDPDDGGESPISLWVALLDAVRCRRGVEAMLADARRAVELTPRSDPWWQTAALVLGLAQVVGGEVDDADQSLADVADSAEASEGWNAASLALAERAAVALAREE